MPGGPRGPEIGTHHPSKSDESRGSGPLNPAPRGPKVAQEEWLTRNQEVRWVVAQEVMVRDIPAVRAGAGEDEHIADA